MAKLAVAMVVFNEECFVGQALQAVYPYADQIKIVEGWWEYPKEGPKAAGDALRQGFWHDDWQPPRQRDRTVEILESFPDPDRKIQLVLGQDGRAQVDNRNLSLPDDDFEGWVLALDADEIYTPETMVNLRHYIEDPQVDSYTFLHFVFYYDFYRGMTEQQRRLYRWFPGMRHQSLECISVLPDGTTLADRPWSRLGNVNGVTMLHCALMPMDRLRNKLRVAGWQNSRDWYYNMLTYDGSNEWDVCQRNASKGMHQYRPSVRLETYQGDYPEIIKQHPYFGIRWELVAGQRGKPLAIECDVDGAVHLDRRPPADALQPNWGTKPDNIPLPSASILNIYLGSHLTLDEAAQAEAKRLLAPQGQIIVKDPSYGMATYLPQRIAVKAPTRKTPVGVRPKLTAGMVVFNGEAFLRETLESVYPFVDAINVVEGWWNYPHHKRFHGGEQMVQGHWTFDWCPDRRRDSTQQILRDFPDPDHKVNLTLGHDGGAQVDHRNLTLPKDGWFLLLDADEIYAPASMQRMRELIEDADFDFAIMRHFVFYYDFWRGMEEDLCRLFRMEPGAHFGVHDNMLNIQPPDGEADEITYHKAQKPFVVLGKEEGVEMFHYAQCPADKLRQKLRAFGWKNSESWYYNMLTYTGQNEAEVAARNASGSMHQYDRTRRLERFAGEHPAIMQKHPYHAIRWEDLVGRSGKPLSISCPYRDMIRITGNPDLDELQPGWGTNIENIPLPSHSVPAITIPTELYRRHLVRIEVERLLKTDGKVDLV
ncbi:MAG: hypothetical protein WC683_04670 [bacterium]